MIIKDNQIRKIANRVLLEPKQVKQVLRYCKSLGDIFNLDLGAADKRIENSIKNNIFAEILKLKKGKLNK